MKNTGGAAGAGGGDGRFRASGGSSYTSRGRAGPLTSRNFAITRGRYTSGAYRTGVYGRGGYRSTTSYGRGGTYYSGRYQQRGGAVNRYTTTRGGRGGGTTTYALRRGARGGSSSYIRGRGGLRGGRGGVSYFRGGRGGYRGGRGRGGANAGPTSKESLDAELDKYMGEENIKKRLDNDLENYFSRTTGGSSSSTATTGVEGGSTGATGTGSAGEDATSARAGIIPNGHIQTTTGAGGGRSGGAMDVSMDNSTL
ncbi:fop carboxy-terminal duplication domain protein [Cystoisospora suis]|uniref:Fop carboxy-terminal duplication domain protein n=1 Tax=Cystoisospora suis TaxID=483139 RepID=A0A2C6KUV4_9APIC|nr:fop carboxy-terminal duplication domain protein [Cystoisospora suis]